MRRVVNKVSMEDAFKRALFLLTNVHRLELCKASSVAYAIWPGENLNPQGAGGAASRVLRRAQKNGLVVWTSNDHDWGWKATSAGRAWLRDPRPII